MLFSLTTSYTIFPSRKAPANEITTIMHKYDFIYYFHDFCFESSSRNFPLNFKKQYEQKWNERTNIEKVIMEAWWYGCFRVSIQENTSTKAETRTRWTDTIKIWHNYIPLRNLLHLIILARSSYCINCWSY